VELAIIVKERANPVTSAKGRLKPAKQSQQGEESKGKTRKEVPSENNRESKIQGYIQKSGRLYPLY
jgi:hypothetical protein